MPTNDNVIHIRAYCNGPTITDEYIQQYNDYVDSNKLVASNNCDLHITTNDIMYYITRDGKNADLIPNALPYRFLHTFYTRKRISEYCCHIIDINSVIIIPYYYHFITCFGERLGIIPNQSPGLRTLKNIRFTKKVSQLNQRL